MNKGWILSGVIIILTVLAMACGGSSDATTPGATATTSTQSATPTSSGTAPVSTETPTSTGAGTNPAETPTSTGAVSNPAATPTPKGTVLVPTLSPTATSISATEALVPTPTVKPTITVTGPVIYLRVGINNISHLEDKAARIFTLENLFKNAEGISEEGTSLNFKLADAADYEILEVKKNALLVLQRPQEDWGKDGKVDTI